MIVKRRYLIFAGVISLVIIAVIISLSLLHLIPLNILSVQQKPEQTPQKVYDYYIIMDEADGRVLMYVPLVVSIGDELLAEDNKYYRIVRIEENQAYARYVKDMSLEEYRK